MKTADQSMQAIVALCRRRGFIFQSSEIYGGLNGFWDFGPLGVALRQNIKNAWWRSMVQMRDDVVGVDCSIIMNPKVWEASGHLKSFHDPMVDCRQCKARLRADSVAHPGQCPVCGTKESLTGVRQFHLMFKTAVGALEDGSATAYLRPETCQGIFANFANIVSSSRVQVPFGIAQMGKSFRNEINPRNFIFRSREFEQMELEFFVAPEPEESKRWYDYWREMRFNWYVQLGIRKERLHLREHAKEELAHYAAGCCDIEYDFPFGRMELEGIAQRGDYDLAQHSRVSGKDLRYFDPFTQRHYLPHVIEPSAGVDRGLLAFLVDAYREEPERTVLGFHPSLAPIKVGVFPLVNRDGMQEAAQKIASQLRKHYSVFYDDKGAIGRRYRRQDEIGTPWCITVDGDTKQNQSVTLRERDSMRQERVGLDHIESFLREKWNEDSA